MQTIVVNSQKGGSGKTMLCAHLAVQAERAGDGPVFLIDTDPQGTLSTWHEHRVAETPQRAEVPRTMGPPVIDVQLHGDTYPAGPPGPGVLVGSATGSLAMRQRNTSWKKRFRRNARLP